MELYLLETDGPQSQAAHALLARVLRGTYGITQPEFIIGPHGKPYLENGPHFSISHTRGAVALAIGENNMGLDIEAVRSFHQRVPERIMSREEYDWFCSRGELKRDFFALWTLKESYYKYLGTGLRGFPNDTDFYFDGKQWHLEGERLAFRVMEEKNLLMTVCSHEQEAINFHRI